MCNCAYCENGWIRETSEGRACPYCVPKDQYPGIFRGQKVVQTAPGFNPKFHDEICLAGEPQ